MNMILNNKLVFLSKRYGLLSSHECRIGDKCAKCVLRDGTECVDALCLPEVRYDGKRVYWAKSKKVR